jgi:hypothetical protein
VWDRASEGYNILNALFLVKNLDLFSLVTAKFIGDSKGKMQRTGSSLLITAPVYWRTKFFGE